MTVKNDNTHGNLLVCRILKLTGFFFLIAGLTIAAKPDLLVQLISFDAYTARLLGLGLAFTGVTDIGMGMFLARKAKAKIYDVDGSDSQVKS